MITVNGWIQTNQFKVIDGHWFQIFINIETMKAELVPALIWG